MMWIVEITPREGYWISEAKTENQRLKRLRSMPWKRIKYYKNGRKSVSNTKPTLSLIKEFENELVWYKEIVRIGTKYLYKYTSLEA